MGWREFKAVVSFKEDTTTLIDDWLDWCLFKEDTTTLIDDWLDW